MQEPDMRAVKAEAKAEFGNIPGVEGFGIGEHSLRIYVQNQQVIEKLPKIFHGVEVEFIVTGTIKVLGHA